MKVLVINCGSSSLKYQLIEMDTETVLAKGICERIGLDGPFLKHEPTGKEKIQLDIAMKTHVEAVQGVMDALLDANHGVIASVGEIQAVGHRVVHGGEFFSGSVIITDYVKKALEECTPLAPLHNPPNLIGINACEKLMPSVPQVAVFDTAFHQTMPEKAYHYAIPHEMYDKHKIRKYGFHGTSHKFVSEAAIGLLGKKAEDTKIVTCHLGNGASICAVAGGKSVDTSMGLTPLEGLIMGTRSGDIDPAIFPFLAEKENMSIKQIENMLNKESGVLGLSGLSSDFRDIEEGTQSAEHSKRCNIALDAFYYRVAKYVGQYITAMNGVDAIVFTAGLGENSADCRKRVCEYLGYLGIEVDDAKNAIRGEVKEISTDSSKVKVYIIPTNEELVIARDTKEICG